VRSESARRQGSFRNTGPGESALACILVALGYLSVVADGLGGRVKVLGVLCVDQV
jgi:hypothetical protein